MPGGCKRIGRPTPRPQWLRHKGNRSAADRTIPPARKTLPKPLLRAISLPGGVWQGWAGRAVVVRAVGGSGADERLVLCPAGHTAVHEILYENKMKGTQRQFPPWHLLTKIVTPTGTLPTNCQRLAGSLGGGTGAIRTDEQKNSLQNNRLKKIPASWHASCLDGGKA